MFIVKDCHGATFGPFEEWEEARDFARQEGGYYSVVRDPSTVGEVKAENRVAAAWDKAVRP